MSIAETVPQAEGTRGRLRTLTRLVADRARSDRLAYTFVDYSADRAGTARSITWGELAGRVDAVAAALAESTGPGDRVAILAPQDLDYVVAFLGALRAGRIAVPLFAPEVSAHGDRLVGALADSAPRAWLTSSKAAEQVRELAAAGGVPAPECVLEVDRLDPPRGGFTEPPVSPDQPAYLQYTSGSTGDPAGAVITHGALVTNVEQALSGFGLDERTTCVGWLPFFHDMGLVAQLCIPAYLGARSVFTTPFSFVRRPARWMRMLAEHPNAFSAAPNFAFDLAADKVSEADRAELDLSGVWTVINGSEPVRERTVEHFAETFGPCGFPAGAHRPSYGLAEATVFVSTGDRRRPVVRRFDRAALAAGRAEPSTSDTALPLAAAGSAIGQLLRIVDPQTRRVADDGQVGEIWLHGDNVAAGYWHSPQRTEETFGGTLTEPPPGLPADRWLRTGDLGAVVDGLLYITGRIKDLIIVDGKNHYPQDIEATVARAHPAVRADRVAAFAMDDGQREGAAVVAEFLRDEGTGADEAEIARAVRQAVSRVHDVRLVGFRLAAPGGVPRTSSGKIARGAARAQYLEQRAGA